MQPFLTFLVTLLVASQPSTAQDTARAAVIASLPKCGLACLLNASEASSCATSDTACHCTDSIYVATAETCVALTCSVQEALVTKNITETLCGAPIRDKTIEYNVISTVLIVAAAVVVFTRLAYKQFGTSNGLGLDDWFILATLINTVPSAILNIYMSKFGLGRDIWTLTPDEITNFARTFFIIAILYFSEVFVLKLSMLCFYLRIFPSTNMRRLIWGTISFDVMFGIAFIFAAMFQCWPISYNWTSWKGEGGGHCVNINTIAWANASVSIGLDIWMLALPLSQLPSLNLHWKKKIGVGLMFFVGTFVTVVSAIRLSSLVEFRASSNLTWDYWGVSLWSTVEIAVGIICACMPSLRLILVRIFPKFFAGTNRQISQYYARRTGGPSLGKSTTQSSRSKGGIRASWKPAVGSSWAGNGLSERDDPTEGLQFSTLPSSSHWNHSDETKLVPSYEVKVTSQAAPRRTPSVLRSGMSSRHQSPESLQSSRQRAQEAWL